MTGPELRALRRSAGLTQVRLCELATADCPDEPLAYSTLRAYEAGVHPVPGLRAQQLRRLMLEPRE